MKTGGWIVIAVLAGSLGASLMWNRCHSVRPSQPVSIASSSAVPTPPMVSAISPRKQMVRGQVRAKAVTHLPAVAVVAMPIAGQVCGVAVGEGDAVAVNQVVASLETAGIAEQLAQARQQQASMEAHPATPANVRSGSVAEPDATTKLLEQIVKAAESNAETAKAAREHGLDATKRIQQLYLGGTLAEPDWLRAELDQRRVEIEAQKQSLQLAVWRAVAALAPRLLARSNDVSAAASDPLRPTLADVKAMQEQLRRKLDQAEIHSPVEGVVLHRHAEPGATLAAGAPLLTVGRLDDLQVIAEVPTAIAMRLKPEQSVDILTGLPNDPPLPGKVLRVYPTGLTKTLPSGDEQQFARVAIALAQRPATLGDNFGLTVQITYDQVDDALTVPRSSLIRSDLGHWCAMLVRDGRLVLRKVETGIITDDLAQIVSGLSAEDVVVAGPSRELQPGAAVTVERP
ncbi:MAG: HlyD family efflux transporter periplasmic adaptor subunit [Phycisphaeraceae bacterium]|nr:HlyD family efflux transporter periplasmic adaptor subunit [Phycisphaeraceae bacterium]